MKLPAEEVNSADFFLLFRVGNGSNEDDADINASGSSSILIL